MYVKIVIFFKKKSYARLRTRGLPMAEPEKLKTSFSKNLKISQLIFVKLILFLSGGYQVFLNAQTRGG
jgi:hypothetical protein